MPDNPNGPGNAAASGSQPTGQAAPASGEAGKGAAPAGDSALTARLETLERTLAAERAERANLRSLHDRQMNDLRTQLGLRNGGESHAGAGRGTVAGASADTDDDAPRGRRGVSDHIRQKMALIDFRQTNPDWADYWKDMQPILSDPTKAAPFAVMMVDPDSGETVVDYDRSLVYLKTVIERDRLRAARAEIDQARASATENRGARRTDATISGQGATGEGAPDFSKMSRKEKLEYLFKTQPDLFDPNDLPAELREA